jgi:hypothetical protein
MASPRTGRFCTSNLPTFASLFKPCREGLRVLVSFAFPGPPAPRSRMTEIKEGTDWTAWGSFDAYDVSDHQRFPLHIKPSQKFTLTVVRPTDAPNKVYFSYGTEGSDPAKHCWTWKGVFLICCKPVGLRDAQHPTPAPTPRQLLPRIFRFR